MNPELQPPISMQPEFVYPTHFGPMVTDFANPPAYVHGPHSIQPCDQSDQTSTRFTDPTIAMGSYDNSTEISGMLLENIEESVNMGVIPAYSSNPESHSGAGSSYPTDVDTTRVLVAGILSAYRPSADAATIDSVINQAMRHLDGTTDDHQTQQQLVAPINADSLQDPNRPTYFNVFGNVPQNIANFWNAQGITNAANFMEDVVPKDISTPDTDTVQSENDDEHDDPSSPREN